MKIFPPRLQIFKSHEGQNRAVFTTENIPFLQLSITQSLTIRRPPLTPPKGELGLPVRPSLHCNGAAIALQRRPRCNMTACSLQPRGGPVARRNPLFDPKTIIKNSPTFAKFESHKGLPASQAPPLGESEGAFLLSHSALIAHKNANLQAFLRTRFCKHLSDIQLHIQLHPTPTKVLQNAHGRDIFLYLSARKMININTLLADKYKNMSLPCAFCNTFVGVGV